MTSLMNYRGDNEGKNETPLVISFVFSFSFAHLKTKSINDIDNVILFNICSSKYIHITKESQLYR